MLPAAGGAEVLDRLAVQIAERLQVEVRKENAKLKEVLFSVDAGKQSLGEWSSASTGGE